MSRTRVLVLSPVVGFLFAAACSANEAPKGDGFGTGGVTNTGGSGGASGSGGAGGSGGSVSSGGSGGSVSSGGSGGSLVTDASGGTGGEDPDASCATVAQEAKAWVDIVWAIDNSCSMTDDIAEVQNRINSGFVPKIAGSGIDYRVIMVSARPPAAVAANPVCIAPPLAGPNCADNPPVYFQLGCDVESTDSLSILKNSYTGQAALKCPGKRWDTLQRPGAKKSFIVVTDDEAEAGFPNDVIGAGFHTWATATFPGYTFHAITGMDPVDHTAVCTNTATSNSGVAPGLEYQWLADQTGGIKASICETDWTPIFDAVAQAVVSGVACEFSIDPTKTDPDKVNVQYTSGGGTPQDIPNDLSSDCTDPANQGWQWDANKTRILLCKGLCDTVKADPQAKVDLQVGCKTVVIPPPT